MFKPCFRKVNSVQEACAKCFGVHILRFEILQITWKNETKHQTLSFQFFTDRFSILILFVLFLHVVCKISNINKRTTKYLAQASCTELTLTISCFFSNIFRKIANYDRKAGTPLKSFQKKLLNYWEPKILWSHSHYYFYTFEDKFPTNSEIKIFKS